MGFFHFIYFFAGNRDVIQSYIDLLSQSKNDFEYIETFREDPFFPLALDI
jgi:hypothetical protein